MMDRKSFIKTASAAAVASTVLPKFSLGAGKGSDKIKVAIVGCGNRGSGALCNMIASDRNIEFVAIADIFPEQFKFVENKVKSYISKNYPSAKDCWKVTPETSFLGLDAIDKICQTDADVVVLTTPPIFRPYHIEKCLKAGKNVFAEKPIAIDAFGLNKVYNELIPLAKASGLTVVCGTQMRYHETIKEGVDRIRNGQIGDIVAGVFLRYEPTYLVGSSLRNTADKLGLKPEDTEYQLRNWLAYRWTSGDQYVEQYVHNLDMALWAFDELPVEAIGSGGRHADIAIGDRHSHTHVQYNFKSGRTLSAACRQEPDATPYAPFTVIGTKGVLEMSFGKQKITGEKPWQSDHAKRHALVCEHDFLFKAIREGKPVDTMKTCADSCYIAIAGREAAYAGKRLKCQWVIQKSKQNYMPADLKLGGKVPLLPVPTPSTYKLV